MIPSKPRVAHRFQRDKIPLFCPTQGLSCRLRLQVSAPPAFIRSTISIWRGSPDRSTVFLGRGRPQRASPARRWPRGGRQAAWRRVQAVGVGATERGEPPLPRPALQGRQPRRLLFARRRKKLPVSSPDFSGRNGWTAA
jgi:hypothetical protein